MALSSNFYAFKVQTLETILAQTAARKVPEWPSFGNFREVIQNPHFLKKRNGGTKENFSKIFQKVDLLWKAQKHTCANGIILLLVCTSRAKTGEDFGAKKRLQKFPNDHVMVILPRSSKTHSFWKSAKGGPREIFQKSPKKMPSFERPKSTLAQMALSFN